MSEIITDRQLHPRGGFIGGGVLSAFGLAPDPERWLTEALTLDVRSVGAIATPVWSGAHADFGLFGALLFATGLGVVLGRWVRWMPGVTLWAAFGVTLAFYGNYLVSAQFIGVSIALTALLVAGRPRGNQPSLGP